MSFSRAKWMAAGAALAGVFVVLTGFGRPYGYWHGGGAFDEQKVRKFAANRLDEGLDDLDASAAQREKLQAIASDDLTKAFAVVAKHKDVRAKLLAQWNSDKPDRAEVHALVDRDAEQLKALAHDVADGLLDAHDVLTPAQRAKLGERLGMQAE